MKHLVPIMVIGIVVLSGLGAAAFSSKVDVQHTADVMTESASVRFLSQPTMVEKDGFVEIDIEGATSEVLEQSRPVLPIYVKTYEIPFRSTDIQVVCQPQATRTVTLTKEVIPAYLAPVSKLSEQITYVKDPTVYGSEALYPSTWYSIDLGAGRNTHDVQVTFVKIVCYPVRYSPLGNQIEYTTGFDITLSFKTPDPQLQSSAVSYDMVIIGPNKFESQLQTFVTFKNNKGVSTLFKSVESILDEYTGYDPPEQVKKFIQYAYDTWNITYVLLVGGLKNHIFARDKDTRSAGWKAWWVPVRYVNMPHEDDEGCLSDLYYGCLYNETHVFDSWDSNGDGVYAAWNAPSTPKDKFDMYPEVYVGRLPVANSWELKRILSKITTYESTGPADKPWYKTFIGIAGKTFYMWEGQPDGEYLCDLAYNYTKLAIPDLTQVKVYATNRDVSGLVPTTEDISSAISQGAGFVDFEGHGSPSKWDTIWQDGTYPEDWCGGLRIDDFRHVKNGDKLPVVVVGGCHNAMYNISSIPGMIDKEGKSYFAYGYPVPACFCYGLLLKPLVRGGAIGTTGCTGYGIGSSGGDPAKILSAELESNFFFNIGNGSTHLGQAHSIAIQKYLKENTIAQTDAFCITNWALLGDPSLLFGGYPS
jgi:hypothetical protein